MSVVDQVLRMVLQIVAIVALTLASVLMVGILLFTNAVVDRVNSFDLPVPAPTSTD